MKDCVIVHYFVQDYKDEFILNQSLDAYKKIDLDIILVSHSPISKEIQKKVKYYLYDSEDELITFDDVYYRGAQPDTMKRYVIHDNLIAPFFFVVDDMCYSFYKAVYNAYRLAYAMGYDFSYYFIGDTYVNEDEIEKIKEIRKELEINNKFGYFEKCYHHVVPFFWMVDVKWLLDNAFENLNSKEEFLNSITGICVYEFHVTLREDNENVR